MSASNPNQPILELRVALTAKDYERSIKFYCEGLGIEPAQFWNNGQGRALILDIVILLGLLELLHRFANATGQLRQLLAAEQQEDDDHDEKGNIDRNDVGKSVSASQDLTNDELIQQEQRARAISLSKVEDQGYALGSSQNKFNNAGLNPDIIDTLS